MKTPFAVGLLVVALAGCSDSDTPAPDPALVDPDPTPAPGASTAPLTPAADPAAAADPALIERGLAAFQTGMCNKCHGPDGTGGDRAPNLTDGDWLHCDGSVEGILAVVRRGVPKDELVDPTRPFQMNPATNLIADEADLEALAAYVHSLSGG